MGLGTILRTNRAALLLAFTLSTPVWAVGSSQGGWAFGGALGITAAGQDNMNSVISQANASGSGPISTSQLGNAWEAFGFIQYRFSGSWLAMQLRPSWFYQKEDGKNGSGQTFEYGLTGYTVFPVARFYMLESNYIRFFSQLGIGFGVVSGEMRDATGSLKFSGADMGYLLGLGSEFCLWGGPHCISIEGNLRYLSVDRSVATSASGSIIGLDPIAKGSEVEIGGGDLSVTLSGIQGFVGYSYHF